MFFFLLPFPSSSLVLSPRPASLLISPLFSFVHSIYSSPPLSSLVFISFLLTYISLISLSFPYYSSPLLFAPSLPSLHPRPFIQVVALRVGRSGVTGETGAGGDGVGCYLHRPSQVSLACQVLPRARTCLASNHLVLYPAQV